MNPSVDPSLAMRLEQALRDDLAVGERVLWRGIPDPKYLNVGFALWIFAVPWMAFSLTWTGIALTVYISSFGQPDATAVHWWGWVMPLFGTPFIAVGGWMLYRPFHARAEAARTLHVLTDSRLMSVTLGKVRQTRCVELSKLGPVTVRERRNGWGDLSVETGSSRDSEGDRTTDKFIMTGVADIATLKRLLTERQHSAL